MTDNDMTTYEGQHPEAFVMESDTDGLRYILWNGSKSLGIVTGQGSVTLDPAQIRALARELPDILETWENWINRAGSMNSDRLRNTRKKVLQIDPVTGEIIAKYRTVAEAAQAVKCGRTSIRRALNHYHKAVRGFKWVRES